MKNVITFLDNSKSSSSSWLYFLGKVYDISRPFLIVYALVTNSGLHVSLFKVICALNYK